MLRPKRLYTFMLQTFLPVFVMTFFICLFIVLMQFLWRYIDDLVGKGLEISVIGELFFYAALTMVPMALPLAILLASLMTFGNLGEKFELTAMKASGVSLLRTMKPLIWLIIFIAAGAFFFQNNVLPVAQTKMWTLLYSMKQKSPEMEIPEKAFYDQIPGLNIYVENKDPQTGNLRDLMIYDVSAGFDNSRIIVADSGHISLTADKTNLLLNIYHGEQFENLRQQTASVQSGNMPYRRESFEQKDILIPFDANFNRMDESNMKKQYVGKNISELKATIDSVQARVDSVGAIYAKEIKEKPYFGITYNRTEFDGKEYVHTTQRQIQLEQPLDIDSIFSRDENLSSEKIVAQALAKARRFKQDYEFKSYSMEDDRKSIRRHAIEMHKKFTLSFACIIFFFIGAPLGAIIRKGGIGMPLVISVILFIIYYIIDNTGYKMAREGRIEVFQGMWLSSSILLPLGVFLTYKAVHDSSVFNFDAYKAFFAKLTGRRKRTLEPKQFTMDEVIPSEALVKVGDFDRLVQSALQHYKNLNLYRKLMTKVRRSKNRKELESSMNGLIGYLSNSRSHSVIMIVNKYPFEAKLSKLPEIMELNASLIELFNQRANAEEQ